MSEVDEVSKREAFAYETIYVEAPADPPGRPVRLCVDRWLGGGRLEPPFLLVHGLASNARLYDGVAARLVAAGHSVASIDLRGHGRSDKPAAGYDYETLTADLVAVMEALDDREGHGSGEDKFGRPVVVGQSFGGNLVLELAVRHPELVSGVACIDGGTIDLEARFASWEQVRAALSPPKLAGARLEALRARMAPMYDSWPDGAIDAALANFEVRPDGTVAPRLSLEKHLQILRTMWSSSPVKLFPALAASGVPVLFLPAGSPLSSRGAGDHARAKAESIDAAMAVLDKARVYWFEGAHHDVHSERPEEVARELIRAVEDGLFGSEPLTA